MTDELSGQVDPAILEKLADFAVGYIAKKAAESGAGLEEMLARVQEKTSDLAKRWPDALAAAGLSTNQEDYADFLGKIRSSDGRLNISDEMFNLGLRFRDVLHSLGVESTTLTEMVGLPAERSFSSGLGSVTAWPYYTIFPTNVQATEEVKR